MSSPRVEVAPRVQASGTAGSSEPVVVTVRTIAQPAFWLAGASALVLAALALVVSQDWARSLLGPVAIGNILIVLAAGVLTTRRLTGLERAVTAARREASASHNQLQELIDNTSANIYMKRVDNGRYILVNREWERLFKVPRKRVVELTDHGVFPEHLANELRANDLGVAKLGRPVQYEESAQTDEGLRTYVSVKFPVFDADGEPYAVCGISTDITERKHAEEEVRRLNAELETRVRERTAELEASTRELDAFAYSVSHDLRAPLRSLHGFSDALLVDYRDVLDEVGQDYLRRLQTNVQRMGRMIDDLLDLSRTTRVELRRQRVDLSAMAADILAELACADPERQAQTIIADNLEVYGDPQLIRMMLQNLLANAWKFSGKRSDATIEVGEVIRDGSPMFFVRDNGAGFDMCYADKLFTAFQRLHATNDFEGTGIGLAIVARIVRRHGGQIFAESEVGAGATFFFDLTA